MRALVVISLMLLAAPGFARRSDGQEPPSPQSPAYSSYIASGSTAEADLARLRAAISKLPGVEHVSLAERTGGATVRVKGAALRTLFAAAARSVGYALRPMPQRSYVAASLGGNAEISNLRESLGKVDGVEQVEVTGTAARATVRVIGDVKANALAVVARKAGFGIHRIGYFVAPGGSDSTAVQRLRDSISKVPGVTQVDTHGVGGGAMVRVQGLMEDESLAAAANSAGFGLQPLSDPGSGQFRATGLKTSGERDALRKALIGIGGVGDVQFRDSPEGASISILGGRARQEAIVAAGRAAGFELQPLDAGLSPFAGPDMERNNPASDPNDRVLEDLTRVGDLAPDFTLVTGDGKGKVTLSEFRGKKPVVLIFGSYT